jgi:adenosine deaminase
MMVPLDPKRQQLENVILWAQRHLLDEIKKKRIVIEMNPASNLRISGAESLGKSPTVALAKEVANGLLACVNTDNPGVFSSCIENEYALLLSGLEQNGLSQGEARNLLERIRNIGMQIVY